jgi:hypothetical protein
MKNSLRQFAKKVKRIATKSIPNVHMAANTSVLTNLDAKTSCYLRPSFSDWARSCEFKSNIYAPNNVLTQKVKDLNPNILIDIGSNIGLSSLSLLETFPSIRIIVGVEAEKENYEMLRLNYDLWRSKGIITKEESIHFLPIYAIASNVSGNGVANAVPSKLSGGVSASGIFRFISRDSAEKVRISSAEGQSECVDIEFSPNKISVDDILRNYVQKDVNIISVVKVDIEGGEEDLFLGPCEWLTRTAFLTVEIHDAMGCPYSSRALLKRLSEYDFAISPENDVLHCYNRKLLAL